MQTSGATQTLAPLETLADRQAIANLQANVAAMRDVAAGPCVGDDVTAEIDQLLAPHHAWEPQWVFARDGTLTAISPEDHWWSGCSVPTRTARLLLQSMQVTGTCGCLLAPAHPAIVRAALDRLKPEQSLITLLATDTDAAVFFRCDDFSSELRRRRLWVIWGERWTEKLEQLLVERPGLPIPTHFVKPKCADPALADAMLARAQDVFTRIAQHRAARIAALQQSRPTRRRPAQRVCVLAGSKFRAWDDAAVTLLSAISQAGGVEVIQFDTDEPSNATPLRLLLATRECDAVITADIHRADLGVVPPEIPVVTWMTRPRVAGFAAATDDRLLVTDPRFIALAQRAGWPLDRVTLARWPAHDVDLPPNDGPLLLVADAQPLDPPRDLHDLSSHRLLWEMLADRMARDPLSAFDRAEDLIIDCARKLGIEPASIAIARFADELIAPAYARALALLLIEHGLPLRIVGEGWNAIPQLSPHAAGAVKSRRQLREHVHSARAIVHALPVSFAHPADAYGRPVIRYTGGGVRGLVANATSPAGHSTMDSGSALSTRHLLAAIA